LDAFDIEEGEPMSKEDFIDKYNNSGNVLFNEYTRNIDNHSFRSEYAVDLYEQLEEEKTSKGLEIKENYRGYDKEIVLKVSSELGHNRPSVVVEHYLR
jgi:hypothetical protein